ncbi:MAG: hypothetical protein BGO09_00235 [Bacteroidetes bacterium 47-18]|nr:MAG: hypothetical protein BGO09_00235 [Bacteroidetes bacterium 47-18]
MNSEFYDHLKEFNTNPYLFVGSGLSRRYLNLPTWESLLSDFFTLSKIEGDFEYYKSKSNGNLPLLASSLSDEFHEIWWKNTHFKENRNRFKTLASAGKALPIKIEIANHINTIQTISTSLKQEIDILGKIVIDGIITTNWDDFLENTFNDFKVFVGQQELLFSEAISIGEIYKIHGCIKKPESLILTEEDYKGFNDKNAYLAAKLLTIFVEHPIVFLGYSLSDKNILQIIDSIVKCVEPQNLEKLKDRLIFVEWKPQTDFEIKDSSIMLPENKVLPIKLIRTDSFLPIFETLSILKRQIPVKILRKLKHSVVEFVKSNQPRNQVYVADIDSLTDESNIEYAIGVGIATKMLSTQGYKAIDTLDIIEDILNDSKKFDSEQLIENTLPQIAKGNSFIPYYKYLRKCKLLTKAGTLNSQGINKCNGKFLIRTNVPSCFLPPDNYRKKQPEIRRNHKDINSITRTYDKAHSLNYIPLLDFKNIDLPQLLKFLRECLSAEPLKKQTAFRKLVCLYDYLKYGIE